MAEPTVSESLSDQNWETAVVLGDGVNYLKGIIGQIEVALPEKHCRVLMLTSCLEGEGTTEVTAILGLTLASAIKRKTLMVDCNPLHPDLGYRFTSQTTGLNEYLGKLVDKAQAIHQTAVENLWVMPIGKKFTTLAAFGNPCLKSGIDMLREDFQYVLIDAGPLGINSDMTLLCDKVDAIVMVVRYGKTRRETVTRTKEIIERAGGKIIGVVLNRRKFPIPAFLYNRL